MEKYIGTKIIEAKPMRLINAEVYLQRKIKEGNELGYLVRYENGYESWSPNEVFEQAYRRIDNLTFGLAIEALKQGKKVARQGWNGKGMFVVYQKCYPQGINCNKQTADAWGLNEGDLFKCEPYLQIKMANGSHSMWVPSINDILAEDWTIIE
jgi:hypothetical protein